MANGVLTAQDAAVQLNQVSRIDDMSTGLSNTGDGPVERASKSIDTYEFYYDVLRFSYLYGKRTIFVKVMF